VPGNSARRGAIRKTAKKPTAGSGGRVKRGLEGRGPTPKAKDRPNHKVYKQNAKAEKAAAARPRRRNTGSEAEWIAGRNSVVEALRPAARGVQARQRAPRRPARGDRARAGPADHGRGAPGAGGQDPGVRVRP